ncbi:MAG: hypothetical protein PHY28_07835 [Dehalococcoidales bacterium]|nr:hypothetical protein [Dehalococcoidales bacterium]
MPDSPVFQFNPKTLLLEVIATLIIGKLINEVSDIQSWKKQMERLWKEHFPEFISSETQNLVGTRKKRILNDFTLAAASNIILPSWRDIFEYVMGENLKQKAVQDIEIQKDANHIIHGGPVVSETSQLGLFLYEHEIDFGYIENGEVKYEVTEEEYLEASKIEVTSREWVVIDKERKKQIIIPERKRDGTYMIDGAILLKCENPYYSASEGIKKKALLGFMGSHAPGSYASNAILRIPAFMDKLENALYQEHIYDDDSFIAALEIQFSPYPFGIPPSGSNIRNIKIKRLEKLTRKRVRTKAI